MSENAKETIGALILLALVAALGIACIYPALHVHP